jgi:hypothetical protein
MTISITAPARIDAVDAVDSVHSWDFGGYPYALMPLLLPDPQVRCHDGNLDAVSAQLELLRSPAATAAGPCPESVEQLYWFRWISGNQAASALWQVLDDALGLVLSEQHLEAARNAEALVDGYSALLIYAGSPTQDVYHQLLRPAMALQHRSFSGRWAQDYVPVMAKLQTLRSTYRRRPCPDVIRSLIAASKRNHRTHVAVAAKLVPGEDSLLRANDGQSLGGPTEDTVRLYDAFYSTCRVPIPRELVVEQLLHRLRASLRDVGTNGLYPAGSSSRHERPRDLWDAEVAELEEDIADVLRRAGEAAAAALRARPTA